MDDYIIETKELEQGRVVATLKEEYEQRITEEAENARLMKEKRIEE